MTCGYLTPSGDPCGRPAVAVWERRDGRLTWMCEACDSRALRVCAADPQWWTDFDRLPLAQSVTQPQGASTEMVAV